MTPENGRKVAWGVGKEGDLPLPDRCYGTICPLDPRGRSGAPCRGET